MPQEVVCGVNSEECKIQKGTGRQEAVKKDEAPRTIIHTTSS